MGSLRAHVFMPPALLPGLTPTVPMQTVPTQRVRPVGRFCAVDILPLMTFHPRPPGPCGSRANISGQSLQTVLLACAEKSHSEGEAWGHMDGPEKTDFLLPDYQWLLVGRNPTCHSLPGTQ